MNTINSGGALKITCRYQIDIHTEKKFTCSALQNCCGSECCDDENIDTYLLLAGGVLLLVALLIGLICWYIVRGRRVVVVRDKQQRVINMVATVRPPEDCVVEIKGDGVGKPVLTKKSVLPANISFVYPVIATSKCRTENLKTGSDDQQPLLDDSIWDEKSASLTLPSSLV